MERLVASQNPLAAFTVATEVIGCEVFPLADRR